MPRIKAPPNAPGPAQMSLAGFTIAFADTKTASIPANHADLEDKSFSQLKEDIIARGGSYVSKVDGAKCTHLITSPEQYGKQTSRINDAINANTIRIVSYDWLAQSLKSNSFVDETSYDLHRPAAALPTPKPAVNGAKKKGKSTKRTLDSEGDSEPVVKKVKSLPAGKSTQHVPVDVEYKRTDCQVYEDENGVIYDTTLNQTAASANANKFYRLQLLVHNDGDYFTWTRWGRVGEKGQSKLLGNGNLQVAMVEFKKKFKDKNGNTWEERYQPTKTSKYTMIEINYGDSEDEDKPPAGGRRESEASIESITSSDLVQSNLPEPVSRLMSLIFNNEYFNNTLEALDYDATKMPLGKLSKNTLLRGYAVLKELSVLIGDGTATGLVIEGLSNQYFSLIPHAFGRNRPPVLGNMGLIKKEVTLLENLTDMQLSNEIMKAARAKGQVKAALVDRQYQGLGMQEMTPLDCMSSEFVELSNYLVRSAGVTHSIRYKVQDVFRIERQGEYDRFGKSKYSALKGKSDRRLLWHGSRCTNFGGILSQGLRIAPPEAPPSGYMFGKGIYLANMSTKSANYCASYNSGGIGLLLLCEAELGKPPLKLTDADYDAEKLAKDKGCISTWGVGSTAPQGWKDAECVHPDLKGVLMPDISTPPGPSNEPDAYLQYDEHIVYDVAQVKLRYLLRVQMN